MLKKKMNKKGFTLVELIIVIAIMAVLAAVLVPTISNQLQRSQDTSIQNEVSNIFSAYNVSYTDYNTIDTLNNDMSGKTGEYVITYYTNEATPKAVAKSDAAGNNKTAAYIVIGGTEGIEFKTNKVMKTEGKYWAILNLKTGATIWQKTTPPTEANIVSLATVS